MLAMSATSAIVSWFNDHELGHAGRNLHLHVYGARLEPEKRHSRDMCTI